ncbi:MAG: DNA polymerase III subunit gamma/tau, partial [Firmicutes bacterium]|nr:DNA polymerase III subunit gamma/tau [Bacillota bacterium]
MTYVSLYRKWRPQTFEEIIGQEHVRRTLRNAIAQGRISHAYLFAGPRGTGKTSTARVLARALNCSSGPTPDPCGTCPSCIGIREGHAMDVIEIDAASNRGIEEIRDLREKVAYAPTLGRYKVYIIDEAHMLTSQAFNALLKTLEEPPAHVVFVLATTEPQSILPTILSRCQRFDFNRLSVPELSAHLARVAEEHGIAADPGAIALIARRAEGSARDALSILEQASTWSDHVSVESVLELLGVSALDSVNRFARAIAGREPGPMLAVIKEVVEGGGDPRQFALDMVEHLRNVFVAMECPNPSELIEVPEAVMDEIVAQAQIFTRQDILRALAILSWGEQEARRSSNPRLVLELAAARLCERDDLP